MEHAGLHPLAKQATGPFEGITNDQVEDLWQQVQSSGRVSDQWPIHMEDAAFGANPAGLMKEQQSAILGQGECEDERRGSATVGLTAEVAEPIDPLSRMALLRRQAASKQASEAAPAVAPTTRANPERFLEDQLAALHPSTSSSSGMSKKPSVMPNAPKESLRIEVVSTRNLEGVTFYLIRVTDQGIALYFTKRYSQLKEFDEIIRPALSQIGEELVPFPSAGMLGIRHRVSQMGLSSFDDQRLQDLRLYLRRLASCFTTCHDVPVLENFFNKASPDRITPKGEQYHNMSVGSLASSSGLAFLVWPTPSLPTSAHRAVHMAWPRMPSLYLVIACLCLVERATGKGFLNVEPHAESGASSEDLEFALEHVLGCGGAVSDARLSEIERALTPVWMVLPKSSQGKVGWRSMRYLAHRFFMQQSSLLVKGFEPMRRLNASERGLADIMEDRLPSLGGLAEESEDRYALQDAVLLVATLEQLIFDAESSLLEQAYYRSGSRMFATSGQSSISFDRLAEVLETYMILWMMGAEHESVGILLGNQSLLHAEFPHWRALKEFVRGQIRSMDFARHREPVEHRRSLLQEGYSFQDAHKVVGDITKSFAPFWESECQAIKSGLVELDRSGTGRVRLADFYGASIDGEWRFGESEAYLREMGVLDETSTMRGKQVIIPNYVQAASNCIVSTKNYLVCCHNACEDIMGEIESAIAAPLATPEQVLEVVGNLTAPSGDEDLPVKITQATKEQLMLVARHHDGMVPIHGRLFAQWLHYVFPRDCPFPHKVGSVKSQTPSEFGVEALASTSEMKVHAEPEGVRVDQAPLPIVEEDYRATQWSPEEEFIVDYKIHAPWERSSQWPVGIILLVAAAVVLHLWSFGGKWRGGKACSSLGADLPFSSSMMKAHMV